MFRTCGVCSNYRWLVPLRVARSLKPIVCRRLLARFGATGRGRSGFPCEPRAVPARPVSSDKLVAMAGFDDEDAWDMECSIDMEDCEPPGDMDISNVLRSFKGLLLSCL